jgi:hypothetical protein
MKLKSLRQKAGWKYKKANQGEETMQEDDDDDMPVLIP